MIKNCKIKNNYILSCCCYCGTLQEYIVTRADTKEYVTTISFDKKYTDWTCTMCKCIGYHIIKEFFRIPFPNELKP